MPAWQDKWESDDGAVVLYHGDALAILPTLEGIDAIVTDPPYGISWPCENIRFKGGSIQSQKRRPKVPRAYPSTIHGDDSPFDPSPWLEFDRVVMWGANNFSERLPVGTTLVWIKRLDDAFGSFLSDAEIAWMKGGHGVYCRRDLSNNSRPEQREHPTQKPVGIMEWCLDKVKANLGEIILDPYMGSGTTGVACIRTGRKFIGCEIECPYFEIAVQRCKDELARFPLWEKPTPSPKQMNLLELQEAV